MRTLRPLFRLARPLYLLLAGLTYVLGAGIARYLGNPQIPEAFWSGLAWVLLAQLSMDLLTEVFRSPIEPIVPGESLSDRIALRTAALWISMASLTAGAVMIYRLFAQGQLAPAALLLLGISLAAIIAYAVPPLRLVNRGFGEFLLAVQLGGVAPYLGFHFQTAEPHWLPALVTFPLTALALALFIVLDFPPFAADVKYARGTLLERIGWERAVALHRALTLMAYLPFAIGPLLGLSLSLLWPALLTLPFGLLEIFWLRNIALGAKPLWALLTANAIAIFGLTAYLLALTFWMR